MKIFRFLFLAFIFYACNNNTSTVTGNKFNDPKNGGFEQSKFKEQETGPGLILIKGGYFTSNKKKEILVPSFYMDITEVTNQNWCEYLYWTKRVFTDFPVVYENAKPNELVWQENGGYNEPMLENYLNHPAYRNYPVVGVSWLQAKDFCAWRTDRVNENILIREKVLLRNPHQQNEPFTTGAYLAGQYDNGFNEKGQLIDFDPSKASGNRNKDLYVRNVRIEDGILLPKYRLPTSTEWEYAANANTKVKRVLPWKGNIHKNYNDKNFIENFIENKIELLTPVNSHWPNDYGLYNMNGNVSEWVLDSYKDKTLKINYSPYTGESQIQVKQLNTEVLVKRKLDEVLYDIDGIYNFIKQLEKERKVKGAKDSIETLVFEEVYKILNIAKTSKGILESSIWIRDIIESCLPQLAQTVQSHVDYEYHEIEIIDLIKKGVAKFVINKPGNIRLREAIKEDELIKEYRLTDEMKQYIPTYNYDLNEKYTSDNKIFKGRNWRDTSNILKDRYLDKYLSSSTIGFRCAMDRLGTPSGIGKRKAKSNQANSYLEKVD